MPNVQNSNNEQAKRKGKYGNEKNMNKLLVTEFAQAKRANVHMKRREKEPAKSANTGKSQAFLHTSFQKLVYQLYGAISIVRVRVRVYAYVYGGGGWWRMSNLFSRMSQLNPTQSNSTHQITTNSAALYALPHGYRPKSNIQKIKLMCVCMYGSVAGKACRKEDTKNMIHVRDCRENK